MARLSNLPQVTGEQMSGLRFKLRVCPESTLLTLTLVCLCKSVVYCSDLCDLGGASFNVVSLGFTQGTCVASWGVFVSLDLQAFRSWGLL